MGASNACLFIAGVMATLTPNDEVGRGTVFFPKAVQDRQASSGNKRFIEFSPSCAKTGRKSSRDFFLFA